jgi:hypothetical protein
LREAKIEEHAAIFENGRMRMGCEKLLNGTSEDGRSRRGCGAGSRLEHLL